MPGTNLHSPHFQYIEALIPSRIFWLSVFLICTGCDDRRIDAYLFGPAEICYRQTLSPSVASCQHLKTYDKVVIKTNAGNHEVVYLLNGIGLDLSNTVFNRLDSCKVVDRDNFACDGLERIDGKFVLTDIFPGKRISNSYPVYVVSHLPISSFKKDILDFFDTNDSWINIIAGTIIFLILISSLG